MTITATTVNDAPCIKTTMLISNDGWSRCRSGINWQLSHESAYLFGILANQIVNVTVFSKTNFCGQTSEAQLREGAEVFKQKLDPVYLSTLDEVLEALVNKYGDGILSFHLGNSNVVLMPNEIHALIEDSVRKDKN